MKSFRCTCGQPLFFLNRTCLPCQAQIGFDPDRRTLQPVRPVRKDAWTLARDPRRPRPQFRFCANRERAAACNWLVPAAQPDPLCRSCRLTRTIPILDRPRNPERLRRLENAKRRVLFDVLELGLPLVPRSDDPEHGLAFDFLETLPDHPPVLTGHAKGIITLNVAEADDDYRERHRDRLGEPYRTLVGHLRHELAHYYWEQLIQGTSWLPQFRDVFGSEESDYGAAIRQHYAAGPPEDWSERFISAYASSHPWEDWAESWAHYLHLRSTLETVASFRLNTARAPLRIDPFGRDSLYRQEPVEAGDAFLGWVNAWVILTAVLNEVSRSMGQPDLYPFVLNGPVVRKLHFVHCVIHGRQAAETEPPPASLAAPTLPPPES